MDNEALNSNEVTNNEQLTPKKRGRKPKTTEDTATSPVSTIINDMSSNDPNLNTVTETTKSETVESRTIKFRNEKGYFSSVEYKYKEDGRVDWRAMIPKQYLVPNKTKFKERNQPVPESIDGLEDKDLLILLAGIKYLAKLRGYSYVRYPVVNSSSDITTAVCEIQWLPCEENDFCYEIFSGIGDATLNNTKSFARNFLGPIAENRAFVRCVRSYLEINICGEDEIAEVTIDAEAGSSKENKTDTHDKRLIENLQSLMEQKKIGFEKIKNKLIEEGNKNAPKWEKPEDMEHMDLINLISRLQNVGKKN